MWSSGRSEALTAEPGLPVPIEIRSVRGARRLRLRYDDVRGILKLTCPPRTSRRAALEWALDQSEWIEKQLANKLPGEPFIPGAVIPIEGQDTRLVWSADLSRLPAHVAGRFTAADPWPGSNGESPYS